MDPLKKEVEVKFTVKELIRIYSVMGTVILNNKDLLKIETNPEIRNKIEEEIAILEAVRDKANKAKY